MHRPDNSCNAGPHRIGFTLVEILIVVVILGILAALIVPRFATASHDAIKASLTRQLQQIDTQIELYRAHNNGAFPTTDSTSPLGEDGANDGWGILVSDLYLKEAPFNTFNGRTLLTAGTESEAFGTPRAEFGWFYSQSVSRLEFYAIGYDRHADRLSIESE
ncbi:MAG TPA: type II secretion system protein [Phycisphaerales bacterium]|nr:type II secretion system protein [Phycisphaerales bacterium]